jgi:integrase
MAGIERLSAEKVETAEDGMHCDGGNLWLQVKNGGKSRSWIFRYRSPAGKVVDMGFGSAKTITRRHARELAEEARGWLGDFKDPMVERARKKEEAKRTGVILDAVIKEFLRKKKAEDLDKSTDVMLAKHCEIISRGIGKLPPAAVDPRMLADKFLTDMYEARNIPKARKFRSTLRGVFAMAKADGLCASNPADKGDLDVLLPKVRHRSVPHASLHRERAAEFMAAVKDYKDRRHGKTGRMNSTYACEFIVLTGARVSEVTEATWGEIDIPNKAWTTPYLHLKRKDKDLRRPITTSMLEILEVMRGRTNKLGDDDPVFPGDAADGHYSPATILNFINSSLEWRPRITNHGFRTTLRGWGKNNPHGKPHLVEIQVDHNARDDRHRGAYSGQDDDWRDRCEMMQRYDDFCNQAPEIIPTKELSDDRET